MPADETPFAYDLAQHAPDLVVAAEILEIGTQKYVAALRSMRFSSLVSSVSALIAVTHPVRIRHLSMKSTVISIGYQNQRSITRCLRPLGIPGPNVRISEERNSNTYFAMPAVAPGNHGGQKHHRVDRYDLEPGDRLHQDQRRLR
jgi:hypothetical protein